MRNVSNSAGLNDRASALCGAAVQTRSIIEMESIQLKEEIMGISKTVVGRVLFLVALGFAILGAIQTQVVTAKHPVTRPFHVSGRLTIMDLGGGYPFTAIAQGEESETGKFVSVIKYPGPNAPAFGITYAANGDQIFFGSSGGVVEVTGGTGRFEGASGSFNVFLLSQEFAPGPAGTTSRVWTYTGEGTLTY